MITPKLFGIKDVSTFSLVEIFNDQRNSDSIKNNPIISLMPPKDQAKIISSLLLPHPDILRLYENITNDNIFIIFDSARLIIRLFEKIRKEYSLNDVVFVAVLRSGFQVTTLLRYIAEKYYKAKVPIIGITPNYIDKIYFEQFKKFIEIGHGKQIIFIDGWMSFGTTYSIIKDFWYKLFPKCDFNFAVIENTSKVEDKRLIFCTKKDILLPWNIALTDAVGLSSYFLHPLKNVSTAFYLPKNRRKIKNLEIVYHKVIDQELGRLSKEEIDVMDAADFDLIDFFKKYNINSKARVKIGVNECIKAFEKNKVSYLFVNPNINRVYFEILKKYADIYGVELKSVKNLCINGCFCVAVIKV